MPIKGLTDRGAAFPRIGELRKGGEKTASGVGRDLDYFRFTSDDKEAMEAFKAAYGDTPRSIRCYLPYGTPEQNFQTYMEEWQAGGLVRRCDGENIVIGRNGNSYNRNAQPCIKASGKPCGCKQVGRLMVIIPELRRFAYVVALTSSINDIIEIHSNLTAALQIRGDLRGVPFILSRKVRDISTPDPKDPNKRVRREKWLLSIEPAPAWVQEQISQLPAFDEPAALPAPDDDSQEDTGVIEQPARVVKPEPAKPAQNAAPVALDDKVAKLIKWHDEGGRVTANNKDWANGVIDEISAARKIQLNQGDTTQGRMDALVAALKQPAQPEPAQ